MYQCLIDREVALCFANKNYDRKKEMIIEIMITRN